MYTKCSSYNAAGLSKLAETNFKVANAVEQEKLKSLVCSIRSSTALIALMFLFVGNYSTNECR